MFLKLDRICKTFGDKVAVDNLSLEVPEGVLYGIIGPNGAGKTTTIRMVMDITAPDSGRVLIDGNRPDRRFRNRVGYLPEERGLYRKMTLLEVMLYMAELKGYPARTVRENCDQWLQRMDLLEYKYKKVEELSKGMQQKLQFITTILHDPDLIILDELFSGLDPLNIELIKGILLELKRAGKTILFSTHVMEQAEKLCDHICMISRGRKVIDGSMAEVRSRFGKNSIRLEVVGDSGFVSSLAGIRKVTDFNNYLELELEGGADTDAILKSVAQRVSVRRFALVEPSLYSIFIDMAGGEPADPGGAGEVADV